MIDDNNHQQNVSYPILSCPPLTDQHGIQLKPRISRAALASSPSGTWPPTQSSNSGQATIAFVLHSIKLIGIPTSRQPGQTSELEVKKRDLRAELLSAEQEAKNKKRKAEGKPPLPVLDAPVDEESAKRRKLLQEALELDKDDDDDGEATSKGEKAKDNKDAESEKSPERRVLFIPFQRHNVIELK